MYDDILFPTDGSEAAEATFSHAVAMAQAFDARLHALYVVNTTYAGVGAAGSVNINSLRASGEEILEALETQIAEEGLEGVTEITEGDPYTEILDYSENVDMIVMGTRGRSGIDKYLLGSVTEKVVRTADVPVCTVRTAESE